MVKSEGWQDVYKNHLTQVKCLGRTLTRCDLSNDKLLSENCSYERRKLLIESHDDDEI